MTQNNSSNDSSSTMMSRRNVLIGLGAAGAGTLAILDNFTDVLDGRGGNIGPEDPPLTNPNDGNNTGTDEPAFQTPWNTDSLVITVEQNESDSPVQEFLEKIGYEELGNAVTFWNDYINENAAFDLTLTFERNHDNPDILIKQANIMDECGPEYMGPGYGNDTWTGAVCVETLRETPTDDDLPVTGTISRGNRGNGVYRIIAQHAIGRLLGYDIWSDPVDVMNPKVVRKLQDAPEPDILGDVYFTPSEMFDEVRNDFGGGSEFADTLLPRIQNPSTSVNETLEVTRRKLTTHLDEHRRGISDWQDAIEDVGLDVYAEAYEETIANDELAYIEETVALITDALDTYNREELADGPDELNTVADRLEIISNWPNNSEPYDLQIHRYVTDAVWSAWAAEQTPTPTKSDSA